MAIVEPFRGLRYDTSGGADVTSRIAPPYDVLSEQEKQNMLAADEHNIVAVDLPHTPPKTLGPASAYQQAADLLAKWRQQGAIVRDDAPAIYAYQQTFTDGQGTHTRRGYIARVRAEQFRATPTGIFPHEKTFPGPKEDRLALTRAAQCQLSPIFGIFADEGNAVTDALYANLPSEPTLAGNLGDVRHEAWRVDDPAKVAALTAAMAERPILIADGHHRYTTALNYIETREAEGGLAGDDPARYVMFVCVSMHDPGLQIYPTHRVVATRPVTIDALADRLSEAFEVNRLETSAERLESQILANGPGWMGVKTSAGEASLLLRLTKPDVLDALEPGRGESYRRLDVSILHRYVIEEVLAGLAGEALAIEYPHSGKDVAAALSETELDAAASFDSESAGEGEIVKTAFLLPPTPLEAVADVCLSGELMPQKSTFFFPKLATGMVLYPHE